MIKEKLSADAKNWERIAPEYIRFIKQRKKYFSHSIYGPLLKDLLELVGNVDDTKILDAGCGEGHLSRLFAQKGGDVYGCDSSKTMLKEARILDGAGKFSLKYFLHDLTFPFEIKYKDYFDTIVSNLVLFDIRELDKVMKYISYILKPNGKFVFSILHPCFNITKGYRYNLRNIGYNGGTIIFNMDKSYKQPMYYSKESISDFSIRGSIKHYHRPIETYIKYLSKNSLLTYGLREPILELDQIYENGPYNRHYLPKFLIIGATKTNFV